MTSPSAIKDRILDEMKAAMRAQEKDRLGTIRLMTAAFKQKEVDERIVLTDEHVLAILDKMLKQRRESISQFEVAKRQDLVDKEAAEIKVIQEFLPTQLTDAELESLVKSAIETSGAESVKDMGKIMTIVRPKVQGRADMSVVSQLIKSCLV
jgi:uncharacterized protein YqeY